MADLDLVRLHDRALDAFRRYLAGVRSDQWHAPTPCTEWDVHDLVDHNVEENLWASELLRGRTLEEVGDRYEGDQLGDDPLGAYDRSAAAAREAARETGAADGMVHVSWGRIPAAVFLTQRMGDLVVHGWDLAEATGQDSAIDPELLEACWATHEPMAEEIRQSGVFATDVTAPPDADVQTRLLALVGRRPLPRPPSA